MTSSLHKNSIWKCEINNFAPVSSFTATGLNACYTPTKLRKFERKTSKSKLSGVEIGTRTMSEKGETDGWTILNTIGEKSTRHLET